MDEKPYVKNAADKGQIKEAEKKAMLARDRELNDLRVVCSTIEGRRLLWRFMAKCKVFGSVWESSAKIHYNAGQQDFGHFIMGEIINADEEILFQMMRENKKGEK